jgi:HEPN domain-containing protein
MVDKEIIREWLSKAAEDFEFALINLKEGKPFFAPICFHFQQAAEKYLKVFIIAHELEFRKIHDLSILLKICAEKDSTLEQLRADCEFLTIFYVDTRYPVHWPTHFTFEETQKAFHSAKNIRALIEQKLTPLI